MQSWCTEKFACKWHYIITLSICQFGSMWKWKKLYKDLDWWFGDLCWVKWWSNDGSSFHWHLMKSSKNKLQTLQLIGDHMLSQIEHLYNVGQSCHRVELVQGVLRPNIIEKFFKNRKDPTLLVEGLKQKLLKLNLDPSYVHLWKEVPNVDEHNIDHLGVDAS